jgi:chemotaxis-related protein WspB
MLMLLLNAGSDRYAIVARDVAEVVMSVELTRLPGVPDGVAGLLQYHGRMVPVVDLCRVTLGRDCNRLLSTRIVMTPYPPGSRSGGLLGLRAEHVTDDVRADPEDLTSVETGVASPVFLRRVVRDRTEMIPLLCLERMLPESLRRWLLSGQGKET